MNLDEAKAAFYHRIPVWYDGTEYPYIQALRYQQHSPYPIVQLELLDKNRNSVVLAPPSKVKLAGELPQPAPKPEEQARTETDGKVLYEWQGVKMIQNGVLYIVSTPKEGVVKTSDNKLTAWTSFSDLLDSRTRRQIWEELDVQGKNRTVGKEEAP